MVTRPYGENVDNADYSIVEYEYDQFSGEPKSIIGSCCFWDSKAGGLFFNAKWTRGCSEA